MNTTNRSRSRSLIILAAAKFACPRTCTPGIECLFGPVLRQIGRTRVVSHTTRVDVELRDKDVLGAAVKSMGGTVLGMGTHRLFSMNAEQGFGFKLPGWQSPCILKGNGTLAFDNYNGHWGDPQVLERLKGKYAVEKARAAATAEGWVTQDQADGLLIYHPSGATITVGQDGVIDGTGFVGTGCDVMSVIENALGTQQNRTNKAEYQQEQAHVKIGE